MHGTETGRGGKVFVLFTFRLPFVLVDVKKSVALGRTGLQVSYSGVVVHCLQSSLTGIGGAAFVEVALRPGDPRRTEWLRPPKISQQNDSPKVFGSHLKRLI